MHSALPSTRQREENLAKIGKVGGVSETLVFLQALARARRRHQLAAPAQTTRGGGLVPSVFLEKIATFVNNERVSIFAIFLRKIEVLSGCDRKKNRT